MHGTHGEGEGAIMRVLRVLRVALTPAHSGILNPRNLSRNSPPRVAFRFASGNPIFTAINVSLSLSGREERERQGRNFMVSAVVRRLPLPRAAAVVGGTARVEITENSLAQRKIEFFTAVREGCLSVGRKHKHGSC